MLSAVVACNPGGDTATETEDAAFIYTNGNFVTMNPEQPTAEVVAVSADGEILAIGDQDDVEPFDGSDTETVDLDGASVFPGFIDTHSHLSGYAFFGDTDHWIDVSSENYYFKPPPGDSRCPQADQDNPQVCFIPVTNNTEALNRIQAAVASSPGSTDPILAWGYDASRFGSTAGCTGVGWACPNLQDGTGRSTLDNISVDRPIFVAASSGHFAYVNTPALRLLNICGTDVAGADCHAPIINADSEEAQAGTGVLVEDLTEYGIGYFQSQILQNNSGLGEQLMSDAVEIYANQGFTLTQEGSTSEGLLLSYDRLLKAQPDLPVTVAVLVYEGKESIEDSIAVAEQARLTHRNDPNLFVAGIKTFADGSTPGYTALLSQPYAQVFQPLTQPYQGVADYSKGQLEEQVEAVHEAGFPMAIHVNGDAAADNALSALERYHDPNIKDMVIHLAVTDEGNVNLGRVKALGAGLTFLINDFYYYGMPFCDQMLGPERASNMYPAGDAVSQDIPFGLHSDTPVTPPDPLFMIWVAATRQTQQQEWRPNQNPQQCPAQLGADQAITIEQGIKAFTVDAAAFYGLQDERGTLEVGKLAEMTLLSADPLQMQSDPNQLSTIQVQGTIHLGKLHENPDADAPVIWPS